MKIPQHECNIDVFEIEDTTIYGKQRSCVLFSFFLDNMKCLKFASNMISVVIWIFHLEMVTYRHLTLLSDSFVRGIWKLYQLSNMISKILILYTTHKRSSWVNFSEWTHHRYLTKHLIWYARLQHWSLKTFINA